LESVSKVALPDVTFKSSML